MADQGWSLDDLPSQAGRTWLITGASHGIGEETAKAVAAAGGRVLLAVRNEARGRALLDEWGASGRVIALDLARLDSVRAAAAGIDEPIDVLVNNAGRFATARESIDGHESVWATNVLGPFAFTNLVVGLVRDRVVVVASNAHHSGRLDLNDAEFGTRRWRAGAAYAQSKLADMLWARALQRRLRTAGSPVTVMLAHPGWALTNLQNATRLAWLNAAVTGICRLFAQPAAAGALPTLAVATMDLPALAYVGPGGPRAMRGAPEVQEPSAHALDDGVADALWSLLAEQSGTNLPWDAGTAGR